MPAAEPCENCGRLVRVWTFPATGRTALQEVAGGDPTAKSPYILEHTSDLCRARRRGEKPRGRVLARSERPSAPLPRVPGQRQV